MYRSGQPYGSGQPDRLTPHEVRSHEFAPRRRGVDAEQVRAFQRRLADELDCLHRELALALRDNNRLKRALHDWQAMHERQCQPAPDGRPNDGHW
ncbi:DivIVA domain-containing protein [Micromonospora sp. NPDC003197]